MENKGIDYSKDNIYDAIGRPDLKPNNSDAGRVEGDWEIQFEKKWDDLQFKLMSNGTDYENKNNIKSFIRSLLNTRMEQHDEEVRRLQREEIIEAINEKKKYRGEDGRVTNEELLAIINAGEGK